MRNSAIIINKIPIFYIKMQYGYKNLLIGKIEQKAKGKCLKVVSSCLKKEKEL